MLPPTATPLLDGNNDIGGFAPGGRNVANRLREDIERFLITDMNNPALRQRRRILDRGCSLTTAIQVEP